MRFDQAFSFMSTNPMIRRRVYGGKILRAFLLVLVFKMAESDGGDTQLSNDLVDCVRQCVREELSRRSSGQQSLIQRTRQLISSSVSSISRDLSNSNTNAGSRDISMQGRNNVSAGHPVPVQ